MNPGSVGYSKLKILNGQVLVEVILIVGIVSVVLLGLVKSLTTSLRNIQLVKEKTLAENYAKETVEWLVYQRDSDWNNLQSRINQTYCLSELDWPAQPGDCGGVTTIGGTLYIREFSLSEVIAGAEIRAVIDVSWSSPRGGERVTLTQNYTKWR